VTSVAFLVDQLYAPAPGGMGTYVGELLPALSRADPSLELRPFHSRVPVEPSTSPLPEFGIETLDQDIRRLYPSWALFGRPALPAAFDSVHIVHSPVPAAVPPVRSGQRLVVTVHDVAFLARPELFPPVWRVMYRAGLRAAVRRAHALIAVSRHSGEELIRRTRVPADRVHVVPLAASPQEPNPDPEAALAKLKVRTPYILFVGTLEPRKNLIRLVRAFRRLALRGLPHRLVLAGPIGWQSQGLLREASEDAPGEVVLVGQVEPAELDALYRSADAFVYPSLYEGFGLPVLEAMSRGVPSVVSASSSLPEVAGEAAVPVDPMSVAGLAEAIEQVITDPGLAARLREAGLRRAARFSWDQSARLTLDVYKAVLQS